MTKEEAIARIENHIFIHKNKEPRAIYITEALKMAIEALEQEPRKGHWVDNKCTNCGYEVQPWNNTNYCPNCGADMREVKE